MLLGYDRRPGGIGGGELKVVGSSVCPRSS